MSLATIENLTVSFGARKIIDGLNLRVGESDRIGLIGRNGSGKSTLLRVLSGAMEPDAGSVRTARGMRIGYLPQELEMDESVGLEQKLLASVPGRTDLETSLEAAEEQLEITDDTDEQMALAQKLADLHEELLHFDQHFSPHEGRRILAGLGFKRSDFARPIGEFSGGWKMRAELASLLFQQPDLLMLDEPTNHLDIPSVAWLSEFLGKFRGATILICHDREFLNEHIDRIVAYEPEGVRQYAGNYQKYKLARVEEVAILGRRSKNLERERDQAERFIRRFRAQATKAKAVQSRIKALEKMDDVTMLESDATLSFRFPPCARSGEVVFDLSGIGHSYGNLRVLGNVGLNVRRGQRVAIVGSNGAGKSTLLKIMAGRLAPTEGKVARGYNTAVGYYAQHVADDLPLGSSVLDEVWRSSKLDDVSRTRSVLGTFFFSGDDVDKKIGVLSGGEKARVALAKLLVDPGNVMLMDEPTNHLDLESAEALAEAMATFGGTLVFVSHNRSFVNRLATRIWNVENNRVEEYPGNLDAYIVHCNQRTHQAEDDDESANGAGGAPQVPGAAALIDGRLAPAAAEKPSTVAVQKPTAASPAGKPVTSAKVAKGADKSSKKGRMNPMLVRKKVAEYEHRIAELEKVQAERSAELTKPEIYENQPRYHDILSSYTTDQQKLEELIVRWESFSAELPD